MDELQAERFHQRIAYLEAQITDLLMFLQRRWDAAIREELPDEVAVARATDEALYDA